MKFDIEKDGQSLNYEKTPNALYSVYTPIMTKFVILLNQIPRVYATLSTITDQNIIEYRMKYNANIECPVTLLTLDLYTFILLLIMFYGRSKKLAI